MERHDIIYWLDSGEEVVRIPYSEIERVDFDDTDIIIEHGDTVLSITLGEDAEDEKYPRYILLYGKINRYSLVYLNTH